MSKVMEVGRLSDLYGKFTVEAVDGTVYQCTYGCITEHEKGMEDIEDITIEDDSGKTYVLYEEDIKSFYEGWK